MAWIVMAAALAVPMAALADDQSGPDRVKAADEGTRELLQALARDQSIARQAAQARAQALCDKADAALDDGQTQQAKKLYQEGILQDASNGRAKAGLQTTDEMLELAAKTRRQTLASADAATARHRADTARQIMTRLDTAEKADRVESIDAMFKRAKSHNKKEEYNLAIEALESILEMDPDHKAARFLKEDCMRRMNVNSQEELDKRKENAFALVMARAAAMSIPQNKFLVGPANKRAKVIQPSVAMAARRERTVWERRIDRILKETKVTCDFGNTPLEDVISYFREASGLNIEIDPRAGIGKTPITMSGVNIELLCCLNVICRVYKLKWYTADEMVVVSDKSQSAKCISELYDIMDLIYQPKDFDARRQMLTRLAPGPITEGRPETPDEPDIERAGREWGDFIRSTIAPDTWSSENDDASGQYTVDFRNGKLVVNHTPKVHRQILDLLDSFRKARNIHVMMQGRFIDMDKNFFEKIGVNWAGLDDGLNQLVFPADGNMPIPGGVYVNNIGKNSFDALRGSVFHPDVSLGASDGRPAEGTEMGGLTFDVAYLAHHQVRAILQAVIKEYKGTLLSSPRMVCFNGQRANIVIANMVPMVMGTTVEGPLDIRMITDGVVFEVQPFVSADQKYVTIEALPVVSRFLGSTTAEFSQQLAQDMAGFSSTNTLQLPTMSIRAVQTTVSVPDGGTIMIGGMSDCRHFTGYASLPIIEKIPIIRWLFSNYQASDMRHTLVMLLRADILILGENEPLRGSSPLP